MTTQKAIEALAPCPFCGGKPELHGHHAPEFWVMCPTIGCRAQTEGFGDKGRAIAAWNRRETHQPQSSAEYFQRRGRLLDTFDWAILEYDEFMKDDAYDSQRVLDRIVERLRQVRDESGAREVHQALLREGEASSTREAIIDALDERTVRAAFEHFQHYAEHPCSASALRSAFVMMLNSQTVSAALDQTPGAQGGQHHVFTTFKIGDRVRKIRGSKWRGYVVGTYSTCLTMEGYAVESENEPGSVQIYPASALEALPPIPGEA